MSLKAQELELNGIERASSGCSTVSSLYLYVIEWQYGLFTIKYLYWSPARTASLPTGQWVKGQHAIF